MFLLPNQHPFALLIKYRNPHLYLAPKPTDFRLANLSHKYKRLLINIFPATPPRKQSESIHQRTPGPKSNAKYISGVCALREIKPFAVRRKKEETEISSFSNKPYSVSQIRLFLHIGNNASTNSTSAFTDCKAQAFFDSNRSD